MEAENSGSSPGHNIQFLFSYHFLSDEDTSFQNATRAVVDGSICHLLSANNEVTSWAHTQSFEEPIPGGGEEGGGGVSASSTIPGGGEEGGGGGSASSTIPGGGEEGGGGGGSRCASRSGKGRGA